MATLAATLTSCGDTSQGAQTPILPEVSNLRLPTNPSGDIEINYTLRSQDSRNVNVELQYSTDDGETWQAASLTQDSTADTRSTSPEGIEHSLTWDSLQDVGFRVPDELRLRVRIQGDDALTKQSTLKSKRLSLSGLINLLFAADRVQSYMYHLGPWDAEKVELAKRHDLVILDPCQATVTRDLIRSIQEGRSRRGHDDVIVLGYVNIGEDARTVGKSDDALLLDPRFRGDATGPRVDPRGPGKDGQALTNIDPLGAPSASGGYASFYLDDNSVDSLGIGDGKPDRNGWTGACYVNAGDPKWYEYLRKRRCGEDGETEAGFDELLSTKLGRGYGLDGVMLGNIDTCAPNTWTSPSDIGHRSFEWTAPGMAAFMKRLRKDFPKRVIMQNRGLFFMSPGLPQYAHSTRSSIDFLLYESYRLDMAKDRDFNPLWFADNKHNYMPRLQAEANRRDGFQVLSLGYSSGPEIEDQTLTGESDKGMATLLQDIVEAQEIAGFRHYLVDNSGSLVNDFVRKHANFVDKKAPIWSSTYNANNRWPLAPLAPTPRIGLQRLEVLDSKSVKLSWDVALDLHPVRYRLYVSTRPLRFTSSGSIVGAYRMSLAPGLGRDYARGVGPTVYPYEQTLRWLRRNTQYYFCIRAVDSRGNEETNRVVLSARTKP